MSRLIGTPTADPANASATSLSGDNTGSASLPTVEAPSTSSCIWPIDPSWGPPVEQIAALPGRVEKELIEAQTTVRHRRTASRPRGAACAAGVEGVTPAGVGPLCASSALVAGVGHFAVARTWRAGDRNGLRKVGKAAGCF